MQSSALPAVALAAALAAGCAAVSHEQPRGAAVAARDTAIPIDVRRPEGPGPFPAVVVMHDCSGLGPRSSGSPARWADLLVRQGYVVLLPDSFSTRQHANGVCTDASAARIEVGPHRRAADAYEALAYARSLPYVDGAHVAVMGGSHGGSTVLATIVEPHGHESEHRPGFAAAIALYPGCGARYGAWDPRGSGVYRPRAPLLILIGEKDDWTPAEACRRLTERSQAAGYPVTLKVYPGALHAFDSPAPRRYRADRVNRNAPGGRGATTGGDPAAWAESIRDVEAFLARHLRESAR